MNDLKPFLLTFSFDPTKLIEAVENLNRFADSAFLEELERLEAKRESERWRTDPLQIMKRLKSAPINLRYAIADGLRAIALWMESD